MYTFNLYIFTYLLTINILNTYTCRPNTNNFDDKIYYDKNYVDEQFQNEMNYFDNDNNSMVSKRCLTNLTVHKLCYLCVMGYKQNNIFMKCCMDYDDQYKKCESFIKINNITYNITYNT
jgi:hypothetical protein